MIFLSFIVTYIIAELNQELGTIENMKIEHISTLIKGQADFQKVTSSSPVVLVNFFAPWCHWCQALAPIYEGVAQRVKNSALQNVATVAKVDCTDNRNFEVCRLNRIQAYPTIIAYVSFSFS